MTLTVVAGPPCAGKSTYVRDRARVGDVIIDFDALAVALGNEDTHVDLDTSSPTTMAAHLALTGVLSNLPLLLATWPRVHVWLIAARPARWQAAKWRNLGAQFVLLDPGIDVCIERAELRSLTDSTAAHIKGWYATRDELHPVFADAARPPAGSRSVSPPGLHEDGEGAGS